MQQDRIQILEKYSSAFRELINSRVWGCDESPKTLLRLDDDSDWNFICVAMDVVGDASLAIENFLHFSLNGPTRYNDIGERYLRLYGMLSAVYIQQEAVRKLYALMHCQNPKSVKAEFDRLEIRTLRHQLASHSVDYIEPGEKTPQAFVPVRVDLEGFSCTVTENRGDRSRTIELDKAIIQHCMLVVSVLDRIYEKSIGTIFRGQDKKIEKFNKKLEDLRFERDGNIIIRATNAGMEQTEISVVFTKST